MRCEASDIKNDRFITFEFTEAKKNCIYTTLTDLKDFGENPLHSHDFYELTIVLSGKVVLQIEKETVTYRAGECCLCNKDIHHKEYFDTDFEIVLFMFQEEYIKSVLDQNLCYDTDGKAFVQNTFFHQLFSKNQKNSFYSAKEYIDFRLCGFYENKFYKLLNAMILEINGDDSGKGYMMKGYFCRFISLIGNESEHSITFRKAKLSREEALLYRVSVLLEEKNGRISRTELENELNYNADYINRVVKKHTGKTLSEYGQLYMLKEAADMLRNTDLRIGDICDLLGYSNRSFFNRLFEAQYLMTPTEYRKAI